MKSYVYIENVTQRDRLLLKSLFDFELKEDVFIFNELSKSECQLIENDFGITMTVVFDGVDFVLDKIKTIPKGYYSYPDFLLDLYNSGYVHEVQLDQELELTANTFLKYDKSINKTSEVLYLHRNTLNYRLDRIKKITGLDLKSFKGAFVFYLLKFVQITNR